MDYQRNLKYFREVKYGAAIGMLVVGVIMFFIGCGAKSGGVIFFSLLLVGGGVGLIVLKVKGVVSDEEYDSSVATMLNNIQTKALNKLGIDADEVKEIAPIRFDGFTYNGATMGKRGKDGYARTNKYESVVLFFSANEVHCYTYRFDTTSSYQSEQTDVYFYRDIVSVTTRTETAQFQGGSINYEKFILNTAGGTALEVSVRDTGNAQRSINAMRQLLRAKKSV